MRVARTQGKWAAGTATHCITDGSSLDRIAARSVRSMAALSEKSSHCWRCLAAPEFFYDLTKDHGGVTIGGEEPWAAASDRPNRRPLFALAIAADPPSFDPSS